MASGVPSWYSRYRELRNRADSAGNLSHTERAELDQLEIKLSEEASGSAAALGAKLAPSGGSAGDTLAAQQKEMRPNPDLDEAFGIPPPPKPQPAATPPPLPPAQTSLAAAAPTIGAGLNQSGGDVTAFDRPIPVVVMGPKPLPVQVEGGLPGGGPAPLPPEQKEGKQPSLGDALNEMLRVLAQPSAGHNQSGSNLAQYAGRVGGIVKRAGRGIGNVVRGIRGAKKAAGGAGRGASGAGKAASAAGGAGPGAAAGAETIASGASAGGGAAGGAAVAGGAEAGGAAAAAGPAGLIVGGAIVFAAAVVEFGKATYQFARAQEGEIRKMAEFGGQQASGIAVLDAHRLQRDVKTASETGDSSKGLTESLDKFEEKLRPIEVAATNIANIVGGRLLDIITFGLEPLVEIAKILNELYKALPKWLKKDAGEENTVQWEQLKQIAEESRKLNRPQWPGGSTNSPIPTGEWGGK